jgi:Uma2 family endonuclease
MAMPVRQQPHWTPRQVRELTAQNPFWTPRYELVDGELLVTPSPSAFHQRAVRLLLVALSAYLERESVAEPFSSPSDVELEPAALTQPDVYVVPEDESRRLTAEGLPVRQLLLAVEVLSPSSGRNDRVRKRPLYQRHVPVYWIVDLEARLVECWQGTDTRPEILTQALSWQPSGALTGFALDLQAFFAKVFGERAGHSVEV